MNSPAKHTFDASNRDTLESLRARIQSLESPSSARWSERITTGFAAFDDLLPTGGFSPGQLVEWLVTSPGNGGSTLALLLARAATQHHNKAFVVMDRPGSRDYGATFYPPAAAEQGHSLRHMIVLRPNTVADELWALDQTLRCPCIGAVWAWLPKLKDRDFRRLQLAAEEGGSLGLLMRPARLRGQPTWADVQLLVETRPSVVPVQRPNSTRRTGFVRRRRWLITVLRCRGGAAGGQQLLELNETDGTLQRAHKTINAEATDHEKSPLPLVTQLACPANRPQRTTAPAKNRNSA